MAWSPAESACRGWPLSIISAMTGSSRAASRCLLGGPLEVLRDRGREHLDVAEFLGGGLHQQLTVLAISRRAPRTPGTCTGGRPASRPRPRRWPAGASSRTAGSALRPRPRTGVRRRGRTSVISSFDRSGRRRLVGMLATGATRVVCSGPETGTDGRYGDIPKTSQFPPNDGGVSGLRKVWILTAPTGFMNGRRRFDLIEHLSEAELNMAINEAQKADEARLVRRLCFVKNLYAGDVLEEAARRVGVSQANSSRWAHAWNDAGIDGLRPSLGAAGPRNSPTSSSPSCVKSSEKASRGRHGRFTHSSKTATASLTIQLI